VKRQQKEAAERQGIIERARIEREVSMLLSSWDVCGRCTITSC
jgi:hypothetical protein